MGRFTDNMATFTDHLRSSIAERGEFLAGVTQSTHELQEGARAFMDGVARDHRARADELNGFLTSFRTELHERATELRNRHQDGLRQMRHDLHETLDANQKARHEAVAQMSAAFRDARHQVADDLRQASAAWHKFAAER
ncbi:MAG TPA: hypothetical protein VF590_26680 [Isosphaeraceae bacterium]|jgi:ElaB/YqjD/DUF883 family membrane-anchored ribosome-binding protein